MPWWSGYHFYTTSFNKTWTQVLRKLKICWWHVENLRWLDSLTMVSVENKAKRLSLVNYSTKTIHLPQQREILSTLDFWLLAGHRIFKKSQVNLENSYLWLSHALTRNFIDTSKVLSSQHDLRYEKTQCQCKVTNKYEMLWREKIFAILVSQLHFVRIYAI